MGLELVCVLTGNDDRGFLDFDKSRAGAHFELGEDFVYFFARLDELDFDGELVRDIEDICGVKAVRVTEACHSFDDGGPGDSLMKEEVEDAGIDGHSVVLGPIAEVEGDFEGFSGGEHGSAFLELTVRSSKMLDASTGPTMD